jgi:transposase
LLKRGTAFAKGPANLRKQMPLLLEDADQTVISRMRELLDHLWQEWKQLNFDVDSISEEIETIAEKDAACQRLRQIPGGGPLVSTATVAAIGNGAVFRKGREFAAWLGVAPRQHSTGGKAKLCGISKRGNIYLRRMFTHGARAVLLRVKYKTGGFGQWVQQLEARAPRNKVIVAIAASWPGSPGRYCLEGENYQPSVVYVQVENTAVEKTLRLESTAFHFSTSAATRNQFTRVC